MWLVWVHHIDKSMWTPEHYTYMTEHFILMCLTEYHQSFNSGSLTAGLQAWYWVYAIIVQTMSF